MSDQINQSIGRTANILGRNIAILVDKRLKQEKIDITRGQLFVYLCIAKNEGITQKKITQLIHEEKPTVAKAVKKLIEAHYIYIEKQDRDKRYTKLYLTTEGKMKKEMVKRLLEKISQTLSAGLADLEVSAFLNIAEQINKNILCAINENGYTEDKA